MSARGRPDPDWLRARRILAVRLDALGDVLMTAPALRALREGAPGREVTLLTSPAGRPAAGLIAAVDQVIVHRAPWVKPGAAAEAGRGVLGLAARLRSGSFDGAVIFTVYSQSPLPAALLCHLADIPLRLAHCRENPYQLLSHWIRETDPGPSVRHETRRQLDLASWAAAPPADEAIALRIPPRAHAAAAAALAPAGGADRPLVALHPGASAPSRRYPPERFARMAKLLVRELGCRVVFTGSRAERPLVEGIRRAMGAPSSSAAGRLTVAGTAALLAQAAAVVTNNTSASHIAAGVGTPVVVLYALTNPQHQPWMVPSVVLSHDVPCRNCYRSVCPEGHNDCLAKVPPEAAVEGVRTLFAARSGTAAPRRAQAPLVAGRSRAC
ncbi:MAG TPA: glycosyltransferase family 9 protein [Candidatus Polarisedimenticolia bacterium]|nr:glycosyltransferase family 9 protein [Candidatus Polarisedimenticolia bacterium]